MPQNHTNFNDVTGPHGYVGIHHGETELVSSGVNEHGLNLESLGFGANRGITNYLPKGEWEYNQKNILAYILGNPKNVDEAMFIENIDGSGYPVIYENKLGVMTNEPEYPVQEALASDIIIGST